MTNLGGIVGIVLATCISGPLTDWGTVWLARRNHGVYEPEFRIFFVGTMLFGVFGHVGWAGTIITFFFRRRRRMLNQDLSLLVGTAHNMPWIGAVACITFVLSHWN